MKEIILTHEELIKIRTIYLENETRAFELLKEKNLHPDISKMYEHDRVKAMGMKEAIDALIYRIDGKFPD